MTQFCGYKKDAEEQVGSVFAVQGIDLNKVGVLIGNDLKVANGKLEVVPANFHNVNGTFIVKGYPQKGYQPY